MGTFWLLDIFRLGFQTVLCPTYTYAHDVGERHGVANYSDVVVAEDDLDPLQDWGGVLRQGGVLGGHMQEVSLTREGER